MSRKKKDRRVDFEGISRMRGHCARCLSTLVAPILLFVGCTAPGLQGVLPYQTEVNEAQHTINAGKLPPSRMLLPSEWQSALSRIIVKLGPALVKTCQLTRATNCWTIPDAVHNISIVQEPSVNASVDPNHRIQVTSGLMHKAGSDGEIAAVIAHEYGHVFAGHFNRQSENAGMGALAGILIASVMAAETGVDQFEEWRSLGAQAGAGAYSQQFELEADYYAALIMLNAGMEPSAGQDLLLRLARQSQGMASGWGRLGSMMANTHPSNDWRIARWRGVVSAIGDSLSVSPSGNDQELRVNAIDKLLVGHNGVINIGHMTRWINPRTGASGMMTIAEIRQMPECNKICVRYVQVDYQQNVKGEESRYACWVPKGRAEFYGNRKPWGFWGGDNGACASKR